jgi:hypothetical protein
MTIRYHERGRYAKLPLVRALLATNLLFAVAVLVCWQSALIFLLGPISWAADQPVPTSRNLENLLEYPLLVFWAGPALAMATGWILIQGRNYKAAFGVLAVPVLVAFLMVVLYWTVPSNI